MIGLPKTAMPPALQMPAVQRYALANGLRITVVEQHALPLADVQLLIRQGASTDPHHLAGRASLAIDMLDEGAAGRSAIRIAEDLEDIGASLHSSVGWDDASLGIHSHSHRLPAALGILADLVLRPDTPEPDFDRRKRERLNSLLQEREEPRILATRALHREIYGPGHPYGRPLHGTSTTVAALQRDDIRAFHDEALRPGNACIVVVGDVNGDSLAEAIDGLFGEWTGDPLPTPAVTDPTPPESTRIRIVDRPGSPQSELRVGRPGARRTSPDYFPLLVMNTILGGSFTSRLNLNLRQDKGYTYGASSSPGFRLGPGPYVASTAVDTAVTADAVKQILLEMERLREEAVPTDELARAQSYLALGLPRTFETTEDIAQHIAEIELYGLGDDFFSGYVRRVREVTAADVQRMARKYLDPSASIVVVAGSADETESGLRALGVGPVSRMTVED